MYGDLTRRGIGHYLETPGQASKSNDSNVMPHVAGVAAVAAVNTGAIALGYFGGPYGKAIGVALLAIPDPLIYLVAYNLVD